MNWRFGLCALLLLLAGCDVRSSPPSEQNQLTQVSIINALMLGEYDGVMTMRELLRYGNLGLGTVDHLDGEMVILDGRAYQAKSNGSVAELAPQTTTTLARLEIGLREHRNCSRRFLRGAVLLKNVATWWVPFKQRGSLCGPDDGAFRSANN